MAPSWVCPFLPAMAGLFWLMLVLPWVWVMVWKGIGLWKAGRNGHLIWFICILIFSFITMGILPIIYIFLFSQKKPTADVEPAA